jgi:hypothetical protein
MPRKPGLNSEFVMFDVVYEDGTQRSNRKVPRALTGGIDGDKPAHEFLIEQDRDIAEKSGQDQEHRARRREKERTQLRLTAALRRLTFPSFSPAARGGKCKSRRGLRFPPIFPGLFQLR